MSFTSALVNGKPARMLPGNVFEAMLPMNSGSNTVTLEARDTTGNVATKSYSVNVTGDGASQTWDANGNLAQKVEGADTWVYELTAENELKRVLKNSVEVASFKYDSLGRRVEKTEGGATTGFTYDGEDILRQAVGSTITKYVHGPGIDEPLASEDGAGALSFLSADGLGSIVAATNTAGAVLSTARYDAWGNIESGLPSPFGFTGREPDATGLVYYRARYYEPRLGRFINEDPIRFHGGDLNLYVYVKNNPVKLTDPTGRFVGVPLVVWVAKVAAPYVVAGGAAVGSWTVAWWQYHNATKPKPAGPPRPWPSPVPTPAPSPSPKCEEPCRYIPEGYETFVEEDGVIWRQCLYACPDGRTLRRLQDPLSTCDPTAKPF